MSICFVMLLIITLSIEKNKEISNSGKKKKKLLYNASINSQLNYASVIWMLCRKTHYLKIGKKQYKALKIIYNK